MHLQEKYEQKQKAADIKACNFIKRDSNTGIFLLVLLNLFIKYVWWLLQFDEMKEFSFLR